MVSILSGWIIMILLLFVFVLVVVFFAFVLPVVSWPLARSLGLECNLVGVQTQHHKLPPTNAAALVPLFVLVDLVTSLPVVPPATATAWQFPPVQALLLQDSKTPYLTSNLLEHSPLFQLLALTCILALDLWPLFQLLALILAFCGPVEIFYFLVQKEQNQSHLLVLLGPLLRSLTMVESRFRSPLSFWLRLLLFPPRHPPLCFSSLCLQLLAVAVLQVERMKGTHSSFVLFIFWALLVFCSLVPLRGAVQQIVEQVSAQWAYWLCCSSCTLHVHLIWALFSSLFLSDGITFSV